MCENSIKIVEQIHYCEEFHFHSLMECVSPCRGVFLFEVQCTARNRCVLSVILPTPPLLLKQLIICWSDNNFVIN